MWASGVKSSGGSFAGFDSRFKVTLTGDKTLADATWEKIEWDSIEYDNNDEFDEVTNHRWTCKEAGGYHFTCSFALTSPGNDLPYECIFQKNGGGMSWPGTNNDGVHVVSGNRDCFSCDIEMAVDDYMEVQIHQYAGATRSLNSYSFFSGHRMW